nr:MAG TPA: hypothetical protein [Caudoviricetes sp.]
MFVLHQSPSIFTDGSADYRDCNSIFTLCSSLYFYKHKR